jgi:iron complex outermembrane recepter protein
MQQRSIHFKTALSQAPLTAAICLALSPVAFAQDQQAVVEEKKAVLDTVTVTAQKRTENLQVVPISIQVLGNQKLTENNVTDFEDYAKLIPSLTYQQGEGGSQTPYFRGVVSGGDGNHSASLPSVGVYLDEQPVTTIGGVLPIHIYDIERIEALAGPQGTLYGSSSQSGTLKIITKKPDASGFAAGYALEANTVESGGTGYVAEGYINYPVSDNAAIRLVAWDQENAGYIDNVFGTRTFPTSGITIDNAGLVENNYNTSSDTGARLALQVDLNEDWTILPSVMYQNTKSNGSFAFDPEVGDLEINRFYPESYDDKWVQAALTVTGKVGNFDLSYNYSYLDRDIDSESDYSDYGYWYDVVSGYGSYFTDNNGDLINPSQYIQGKDRYKNYSQELRISSDQDKRLSFIGGLFWQRQTHDIQQDYRVDDLNDDIAITGWPDTIWLTKQLRTDEQKAIFGELTYDITDKLSALVGFRYFQNDNSLEGFFGYSTGYSSNPEKGEAACEAIYGPDKTQWPSWRGAPCKQFDKSVSENGTLGKFNLTYNLSDTVMFYGTYSEGYRPGGINRRATLPPYLADYLDNIEFGWKTSWMENRLVFNGAVFQQKWDDFQFAILGANGLTEIKNANQAEVNGLEMDVNWAATYNLTLSAGFGWYDSELTENYCGLADGNGNPVTDCAVPEAPEGTRLPITPEFKGNLNARYTWDWKEFEPFFQLAYLYEGERRTDLRIVENAILGDMPSYNMLDLSAGIRRDNWTLNLYVKNLTDERAQFNRFTMCGESICGASGVAPLYPNGQIYEVVSTPRTIGLRFAQDF